MPTTCKWVSVFLYQCMSIFFTVGSCTVCVKVNRFNFDFMLSLEMARFMKPDVVCICIFGINIDAGITGVQEVRQRMKEKL